MLASSSTMRMRVNRQFALRSVVASRPPLARSYRWQDAFCFLPLLHPLRRGTSGEGRHAGLTFSARGPFGP